MKDPPPANPIPNLPAEGWTYFHPHDAALKKHRYNPRTEIDREGGAFYHEHEKLWFFPNLSGGQVDFHRGVYYERHESMKRKGDAKWEPINDCYIYSDLFVKIAARGGYQNPNSCLNGHSQDFRSHLPNPGIDHDRRATTYPTAASAPYAAFPTYSLRQGDPTHVYLPQASGLPGGWPYPTHQYHHVPNLFHNFVHVLSHPSTFPRPSNSSQLAPSHQCKPSKEKGTNPTQYQLEKRKEQRDAMEEALYDLCERVGRIKSRSADDATIYCAAGDVWTFREERRKKEKKTVNAICLVFYFEIRNGCDKWGYEYSEYAMDLVKESFERRYEGKEYRGVIVNLDQKG